MIFSDSDDGKSATEDELSDGVLFPSDNSPLSLPMAADTSRRPYNSPVTSPSPVENADMANTAMTKSRIVPYESSAEELIEKADNLDEQ